MNDRSNDLFATSWRSSRRDWLKTTAAAGFGGLAAALTPRQLRAAESDKALIAITLDLEMSANFPTRETTHWNFEKGNLNDETKRYSVEAARRVKAAGGLLHFFAVGQVFEHPSVDWLREIIQEGHPVGNHTYDHINVTAKNLKDLQFRFQRAPWLLRDMTVDQAIRENVMLMKTAMRARLGVDPVGFRTPGGFANGLREHPDVRAILKDVGYDWVSSLYPPPATQPEPLQEPSSAYIDSLISVQPKAQPFVYPDGLIEIPMSPISDIGAFRYGQWKLDWFLRAIRKGVEWAIDNRAVFDFLGHPSCLYVVDPEFKTVDLICDLVRKAGNKAAIADLTTISHRAKA